MILSDVSIRKALADGRIVIDPLDERAIQPSSVDLRVDRYFRVFRNHTTPYIDPKRNQEDLTELVEVSDEEPFILHPGEFVLGSTLERVAVPDDMVGRLEGKSSVARLGLLIHSSLPGSEPVLVRVDGTLELRPIADIVAKRLEADVVAFDPRTFEVSYHPITGWYEGPADRIFEVRLASGRTVRVTAGHNLFTLDRDGEIEKIRTGALRRGVRVAVPRRIPDPVPDIDRVEVRVLDELPESLWPRLVVRGAGVALGWREARDTVDTLLRESGIQHVDYYWKRQQLPLLVALQVPEVVRALRDDDRVDVKGGRYGLPLRIELDLEMAWLLGLYVAEGSLRAGQVNFANTNPAISDRVERGLARLGVSSHRDRHGVTALSSILSLLIAELGTGESAPKKRIPRGLFTLPAPWLAAFLDGLVDGDGSRHESRTSVWTSSPELVADLLLLAARLGVRAGCCALSPTERTRVVLDQHLLALPEHVDIRLVDRARLNRLVEGDLMWDTVLEVRDTGSSEPIYDIEVRPAGRKIENFLAGQGGVLVSNTAGFVDAGWDGYLTLELSNVANLPIAIYPGMKIGQISFLQMTTAAEKPYGSGATGSKYQGQRGPTPSRYYLNFQQE